MMDRLSLDVSINHLGMKNPLTNEEGHEFYMIIETSGSHLIHDEEKLSLFVEKAINNDFIKDGTLTNEITKLNVCNPEIMSYLYYYGQILYNGRETTLLGGESYFGKFNLQNIWALRERISEGVLRDGYVFKYDISLPFSCFYEVVEVLRNRIRDSRIVRISGYGHLGILAYAYANKSG